MPSAKTRRRPGASVAYSRAGGAYSGRLQVKDIDFTNVASTTPLTTSDVIYENCNFAEIFFRTSELSNVTFKDCNLRGAVLNRTRHFHTEFINCDLSQADFYFAELHSTTFINSPLEDAHLLHALVPSSFTPPTGYVVDHEVGQFLDQILDIVVYDSLWLSDLPGLTGVTDAAVRALLGEHPNITPRSLFALLAALSASDKP